MTEYKLLIIFALVDWII